MPEYLRALVVILLLAGGTFWMVAKPAFGLVTDMNAFRLRRNVWLCVTVAAFAGYSFWVFAAVALVAAAVVAGRDGQRIGLYAFVMFAVPPIQAVIPGMGVINYLAEVDYLRILSLAVLVPACMAAHRRPGVEPLGRPLADKFLLGYLLLQLLLQWPTDTATNTLRNAVYAVIDVVLPYYAASRALRSVEDWRDALSSFVVAVIVMAPMAAFEYVKHWLLYSSLPSAMGVRFGMGHYLNRGDSLRALVSTGHSLVLGYVSAVALAFFAFVHRYVPNRKAAIVLLGLLLVALFAPVSRGPWIGAAVVAGVLLLTAPNKTRVLTRSLAWGLPACAVLLVTPMGDKIIDLLPFVGTVDAANVTYRQLLFDVSMQVIGMNPWLGSSNYLSLPIMQQLVQGEGIIDLVNSYISIALASGIVGLTLFCGVFASSAWGVFQRMRRAPPDDEAALLGRALLAATAGVLVMIATLSSILTVPTVYWMLAGLGVGFSRLPDAVPAVKPVVRPLRTPVSPRRRYG